MTAQKMQSAYGRIIEHYGSNAQIDIAIEEMAELIKALIKLRRAGDREPELTRAWIDALGELADVEIMTGQLEIILRADDGWLGEKMEEKVERQIERMENGE